MVEIYNETIVDLLTPSTSVLDLKAQGNKIVLPGITELTVENLDDIDNILSMGQKNRSVASTKMNSTRYSTKTAGSFCVVLVEIKASM